MKLTIVSLVLSSTAVLAQSSANYAAISAQMYEESTILKLCTKLTVSQRIYDFRAWYYWDLELSIDST